MGKAILLTARHLQDINGVDMLNDGLICAYQLKGSGQGIALSPEETAAWSPHDGLIWVHLDRGKVDVIQWIQEAAGLDELVAEALLEEETRPRCSVFKDGILVILRGVNLNPGAVAHDMISLRCWFDHKRIITLRMYKLQSVQDIRKSLEQGVGPSTQGQFIAQLVESLSDYMAPVVEELDVALDQLEEESIETSNCSLRHNLADVRRQAILLRRYIYPQVEVARQLHRLPVQWLDHVDKVSLLETMELNTRIVEDLDSIRERAMIVQDELEVQNVHRLNRLLYYFTLITIVFLPLTFVTGLLGINVGGIPGSESPQAFWLVTAGLVGLVGLQMVLFHRLRLF